MDMKKQALRQFLRKQSQAQIPGTVCDIKQISYFGALLE
jgi:hypothetical protein